MDTLLGEDPAGAVAAEEGLLGRHERRAEHIPAGAAASPCTCMLTYLHAYVAHLHAYNIFLQARLPLAQVCPPETVGLICSHLGKQDHVFETLRERRFQTLRTTISKFGNHGFRSLGRSFQKVWDKLFQKFGSRGQTAPSRPAPPRTTLV